MKAMVGGILLSYELVGRGQPVALLHGLGLDHRMWEHQVGALARYFRVLAVDVRGHGRSERVRAPFSIEGLADDLHGLLAALGVERLALVGCSMGGCVAQTFALKYPDLVTALVLVSTASSFRAMEQTWLARAQTVRLAGHEPQIEPALERWFTDGFRAEHPTTIDAYREMLRGIDAEVYALACEALAGFHVTAELHSIRQPTLVVAGDQDPSTPPEMACEIHEEIGASILWIVENARHLVPVEHGGAFNDRVLAFLTEIVPSAI